MTRKTHKPVASAIGAAVAGSMMLAGAASAADNPFGMTELNGGYLQTAAAQMEEKKSTEAKGGSDVGEKKSTEAKGGSDTEEKKPTEGKCGGMKK